MAHTSAKTLLAEIKMVRLRQFYPLPDAILFLYLLSLNREYFWGLGGSSLKNAAAWCLSTMIAGGVTYVFTSGRGNGWEGTESELRAGWHSWRSYDPGNASFHFPYLDGLWIAMVVAPVMVFFFLRAAFPAFEMDHLNYHLVNTERALRGWPMTDGDFFPGTLLVNPAPDMAFGVLKYLIGYRLAPILNVAVLLWTANLLNEIIAPIISRKAVRYLAVLFIIATDQACYLVNIYMVDLLSLPLLMAATLFVIRLKEQKSKEVTLVKISLLLGISIAFKLTNIFFAVPIAALGLFELINLYRDTGYLPRRTTVAAVISSAVLPCAFFFIYMQLKTGNPFFPYFNGIFRSPLMSPTNYHDTEVGPQTFLTRLFWPVISFVYPTNLSAMNTAIIYSGRLNLGFVLAFILLFVKIAPTAIRKVSFILVFGCTLWSFGSGDLRYALIGEVFGGIVCCFVFRFLYDQAFGIANASSQLLVRARIAFALIIGFALAQSAFGIWFGLVHFECANENQLCDRIMQPVFTNAYTTPTFKRLADQNMPDHLNFNHNYDYMKEAKYFFRDRHAQDFFSDADKAQFKNVGLWVNCIDATSGYMTMVAQDVPMVSVAKFLHLFDYMSAEGSRLRVRELVKKEGQKGIYTLVQPQRKEQAQANLAKVGLKMGDITKVSIPLYSPNIRTNLMLIQLSFDDDRNKAVSLLR
ncbi:MAG: hypothetical protein C5B55_07665 [Blastocatellia bacterium]|nr:MAG: hypothetical protein C5B55_07665 [Blastocatellia bacterium]